MLFRAAHFHLLLSHQYFSIWISATFTKLHVLLLTTNLPAHLLPIIQQCPAGHILPVCLVRYLCCFTKCANIYFCLYFFLNNSPFIVANVLRPSCFFSVHLHECYYQSLTLFPLLRFSVINKSTTYKNSSYYIKKMIWVTLS